MRLAWLPVFALVLAPVARAAQNPDLARAQQLFNELKYPAAAHALEAAAANNGNSREDLLTLLELEGICAGALNRTVKAAASFEALLALDPDHSLKGDWPPRVTTPFFEAKAWAAEHGALRLEATAALVADGVQALHATLPNDPLNAARAVRFHVRIDGGAWNVRPADLQKEAAVTEVAGHRVEWWVELLGDREAVLLTAGKQEQPLVAEAPATSLPARVESSAPSRVEAAEPTPRVEPAATETQHPPPPLRPLAYAAMATGAASLGVGIFFGARSAQERSTLEKLSVDPQGLVTSITQRRAFQLDDARRSDAAIGNALMATGIALAVGGGALWGWGALSVAPTPGGVAVSGALP